MSRTLTPAMEAHLAGGDLALVMMLRLDLVDGTTLALTTHNAPLAFDLGDGNATYYPNTGIIPSDVSLSAGLEADEVDVTGPVADAAVNPWDVTRAAVIGGRFDDARGRLFMVNWEDLGAGAIKLMDAYVVKADVKGVEFSLTLHSQIGKLQQEIGRVITAYCDADFGDARCTVVPQTVVGTVTGATSDRAFTVSFAGTFANDFFERGTVQFLTGALAGTRKVEISSWSAAGAVTLFMPLAEVPEVGATLTITQGCFDPATRASKTRAACMHFSNIDNGRFFPDVPGSDQVLRYPVPS